MRKRALLVGLCLAGILFAACSRPDLPILDRPTSDGIPLRRIVPGHGAAVLLVYDPADVFACGGSISEWVAWGRRNPGRLVLAFTRRPTAAEAKLLLTSRIRSDLVLARPPFGSPALRSTEILVVDGRVARADAVSTRVVRSPLLRFALTQDPAELDAAARFPAAQAGVVAPSSRRSLLRPEER